MIRTGGFVLAFGLMATSVQAAPVVYDAVLTTDLYHVDGGKDAGTQGLGNLDLTATWKGSHGWDFKGYVVGDFGGNLSADRVGDIQGVSNIDAPPAWHLLEAYARHTSSGGHWVSSVGLMNLNGVFDVQKPGRLFLNSSHGIGPDYSQSGPSIFPQTSLGTMVTWIVDDKTRWRFGVFDGVPGDPAHPSAFVAIKLSKADGASYIGEYEREGAHGYVRLDHWGYTADYSRWDGSTQRGNSGTFAQVAGSTAAGKANWDQGVYGWLRLGVADARVNRIDRYTGLGVTAPEGQDHIGIAVADAHFSRDFRAVTPGQGPEETDIEVTLNHAVDGHLSLQPDVQYVHRPYGQRTTRDALVAGVRLVYDLAGGE